VIALDLPLIGPAASILEAARALAQSTERLAILLHGTPGVGKTHLLDLLALELTRSKFAIEHVNGQSVSVDLVRQWRERGCYGNLFSDWTVKRIDELDHAGGSASAELLTLLDYLPPRVAILATTNDYGKLRGASKGRLETRFKVFRVDAPSIEQAVAFLRGRFKLPAKVADAIARGAVPDGCLPSEGVNMRACIEDAQTYIAARAVASVTPLRAVKMESEVRS
jgi:chromosomal replication initiation ATPase DnaA